MLAVNDDYYEDLTPETTKRLLDDLRSGKRKIKPGPLSGRKSCEPKAGLTSLKEEPWGPGAFMRTYAPTCVYSEVVGMASCKDEDAPGECELRMRSIEEFVEIDR